MASAAMPPKTPRARDSGRIACCASAVDLRRDRKIGEVLLARIPPPLHGSDAGRTITELHAQIDELADRHRLRESRCRDDIGGELGDLILHDLPVEQPDADDLERDAAHRIRTGGRRSRRDRHGHAGTEVQPHGRRRVLGDHHLVRPRRIGHPTAGDGKAVLVEEQTIDAAHEDDVAVEGPPFDPSVLDEGRLQCLT